MVCAIPSQFAQRAYLRPVIIVKVDLSIPANILRALGRPKAPKPIRHV
jgi:hypothetical protein